MGVNLMKFKSAPSMPGSSASGTDGVSHIDPKAVSGAVLEDRCGSRRVCSLGQRTVAGSFRAGGECLSDAIGERLAAIAQDHGGMNLVQSRTSNAVAEVLTTLNAADTSMSDTARTAAAETAQAKTDDESYAFERPERIRGQASVW